MLPLDYSGWSRPKESDQVGDFVPVSEEVPTRKTPDWLKGYKFKAQEFTFARVKYKTEGRRWGWNVDYPDADQGISARLKKWTSLKVDEKGAVIQLTDPDLSKYPFLYLAEPGGLALSNEEITSLRKYLTQGGFLMMDDFWGDDQLKHVEAQLAKVFPKRKPVELPLKHPLFHCVFDLKKKPQVCAIGWALRKPGVSWEPTRDGSDTSKVHYRAILDDKKRIMVLLCHNTDLADGWERSSDNEYYTREFSEKRAFPMGMNIIFYALTGGEGRKEK